MRSHYLFIFYSFYISFSCVSLLTISSSLLSSSIDPSLICTSPAATNPSLPTFPLSLLNPHFVLSLSLSLSLSVFSSDQVPYYPTYLKSEHFVSLCTHPQATPLVAKSGGQYQLGLNSSVKIVKPCPSVQVSSVSTK